jgi:hypothetical protein
MGSGACWTPVARALETCGPGVKLRTFLATQPDLCLIGLVRNAANMNNAVAIRWRGCPYRCHTRRNVGPGLAILDANTIDTIHIELSAEEVKALTLAPPAASRNASVDRAPDVGSSRRPGGTRRATVFLVIALVTASVGTLGYLATASVPAPRSSTRTSFAIPTPTIVVPEVAPSESPAVRFANPFDRTEFFEFPAGISQDAELVAVAEILLERAKERHYRRLSGPKSAAGKPAQ